jgi:choline dehydrogenase-like flavoprotein
MTEPLAVKPQSIRDVFDYIIVGAGAAGSVVAGELSKTGAEILVIESGPADSAPTNSNPSVWFYHLASPWNNGGQRQVTYRPRQSEGIPGPCLDQLQQRAAATRDLSGAQCWAPPAERKHV